MASHLLIFPTKQAWLAKTLFQLNPSLKDILLKYTKENITGLKGEDLYLFFHDTIIPKLIEQEKEETNETLSKKEILKQYDLTTLCLGTIYKWMSSFGFKFCLSKKTYYVDGHEKPETVVYCKEYVSQYLKTKPLVSNGSSYLLRKLKKLKRKMMSLTDKKVMNTLTPYLDSPCMSSMWMT